MKEFLISKITYITKEGSSNRVHVFKSLIVIFKDFFNGSSEINLKNSKILFKQIGFDCLAFREFIDD